ncbi:Poly [ADP-ribose] polymerase 11 [Collichthys lucidus]|uniref:Poly [ADP-ribose] polymerase n=1 Tax=Collichthys lucidus TaxID=240159 RepID=A0A4U5VQF0_COLLU|nr:Poly [ADP-ribose] polymerase 11 [Collichthys lucidus]
MDQHTTPPPPPPPPLHTTGQLCGEWSQVFRFLMQKTEEVFTLAAVLRCECKGVYGAICDEPDNPLSSEDIESHYKINSKAVLKVSSSSCDRHSHIDFSEVTAEYQCVAGYVKNDGLLRGSILSISRIQNIDLWEIFCRKKKQLMRIHGVKELQERRLFHGTEIKNVDSICKYNFDVRVCHTTRQSFNISNTQKHKQEQAWKLVHDDITATPTVFI